MLYSGTDIAKLKVGLKKLNKRYSKKFDDECYYNCWGFIAYLYKWSKELLWLRVDIMEKYLDKHTRAIKTPIAGDIAVFRSNVYDDYGSNLEHTAILIEGKKRIIHKPGGAELEIASLKRIKYIYNNKVTYRRLNK
jgi:hypothetical protein